MPLDVGIVEVRVVSVRIVGAGAVSVRIVGVRAVGVGGQIVRAVYIRAVGVQAAQALFILISTTRS